MTRFVKFEDKRMHGPRWINPDQVVSVTAAGGSGPPETQIYMSHNEFALVDGTPAKIVRVLQKGL